MIILLLDSAIKGAVILALAVMLPRRDSAATRRSVSATIGAMTLILGASIAIPVDTLRADDDKPPAATAMKPKQEDAQQLFQKWQAYARTDGKIPGALIGTLGKQVRYFISLNKEDSDQGRELSAKFEQLLPRFDAAVDWSPSDVIVLLDDVAAIHRIPLGNALAAVAQRVILDGQPLPAELRDAPWGEPSPEGLRVAWHVEPRAKWYPVGTSLKSRILVHNSGDQTVFFMMPSWQQSSEHSAKDAQGAAVKVTSTYWTTRAQKVTHRLAPGEYCETPAPGIGIGAKTDQEDWANVRVGAWIDASQGDEVRLSPGAVEVRCAASVVGRRMMNGRPLDEEPKDAADLWRIIIAERVQRELPLPDAAVEREHLIRRVTTDLFGEPPAAEEIADFVADDSPTARATLEKRLLDRPGIVPFSGTLPPGEIRFRVLGIDPEAANRPRVVTGPGYYILGDHQRLQVEQSRSGNRRTNKATIRFFAAQPKTDPPGKPYEIKLPDGPRTFAITWDRDANMLWILQSGLARSYDFTNPAQVKETRFESDDITKVPARFRAAMKAALDVPGGGGAAKG